MPADISVKTQYKAELKDLKQNEVRLKLFITFFSPYSPSTPNPREYLGCILTPLRLVYFVTFPVGTHCTLRTQRELVCSLELGHSTCL